jgi:hypothetical protein
MYLRGLVAGAARLDLDGNPAGEVIATSARPFSPGLRPDPIMPTLTEPAS